MLLLNEPNWMVRLSSTSPSRQEYQRSYLEVHIGQGVSNTGQRQASNKHVKREIGIESQLGERMRWLG